MKALRKQIAVLLAVILVMCSFTTLGFSVSAAETSGGTITVTSNLGEPTVCEYNSNSEQVQVTYYLQSDEMILDTQGYVTYDQSVLKLASTTTAKASFPVFTNAVTNFNLTNKVKFCATSLDLYDFTTEGVFVTLTFDIIGSGDTTVSLNLEVLTATTADTYFDHFEGAQNLQVVYYGQIDKSFITFRQECKVTPDVVPTEPTTVAPTTVQPTTVQPTTVQPTTVAPTQAPTEPTTVQPTVPVQDPTYSPYYLRGNFYLALQKTSDANVVSGTLDLTANTFKFDVTNAETGVHYGRNSKYTDTIDNALFGKGWGYTTFTTTGGTYTFTYNTKTNRLTVTCDSAAADQFSTHRVRGSFNFALKKTDTANIVKNTIDLPVGTYKFNVTDENKLYGRMGEYTDAIGRAVFGSSWGYCTFNVSAAGTFEFTYDTASNYLTILPKKADDSGYSIIGTNIAAVLKKTSDANVVSGTATLAAGAYKFKVSNGSASYFGRKAECTDTLDSALFGSGWDWFTLNATGGTYTFTYNTKTNRLTITKA